MNFNISYDPNNPPPCPTDPPPIATEDPREIRTEPRPTLINKIICAVRGHVRCEFVYEDSHGGLDGMTFCSRCGKLDV